MNSNVFIKATVRRPIKTIIIFLLITIVSLSFAIRGIEYFVVSQVIDRATDYYKPVGRISAFDASQWEVENEIIDLFTTESQIDYLDVRRYFYAVTPEIYSADNDGFNNAMSMSYVYGVVVGTNSYGYDEAILSARGEEKYQFNGKITISVDEVAVGFPEYVYPGERIEAEIYSNEAGEVEKILSSIERGKRYLWKIQLNPVYAGNGWRMKYIATAIADGVLALEVPEDSNDDIVGADIVQDMLQQSDALHALTMKTSRDISVLPDFLENFYLTEGRLFTKQDYLEKNKVCLIRQEMADLRDLKIGDEITFNVYKSEDVMSHLLPLESMKILETEELTYKIIGIYGSNLEEYTTSEFAVVWIPDSTIVDSYKQKVDSQGFHIVLKSPEDLAGFIERYEPVLAEKGYTLSFFENGWETFAAATEPMQQAVLTSVTIFLIVLIIVMALCAVFALMIHKNTWVRTRLLGVPVRTLDVQLMIPLFIVGLLGTGAGVFAARQYAVDKAMETLSALESLQSGVSAVGFSSTGILLLWLCIFTLWVIFLFVGILMQNRGSLLRQLQGHREKR